MVSNESLQFFFHQAIKKLICYRAYKFSPSVHQRFEFNNKFDYNSFVEVLIWYGTQKFSSKVHKWFEMMLIFFNLVKLYFVMGLTKNAQDTQRFSNEFYVKHIQVYQIPLKSSKMFSNLGLRYLYSLYLDIRLVFPTLNHLGLLRKA